MATKPAPAADPEKTDKPEEGEIKDGELKQLAADVNATLFGEKRKPEPEKKPAAAAPEKKPEAEAKPTAEAVAGADKKLDEKPADKPPGKRAGKPVPKSEATDDVIQRTARATAEAVGRELRPTEEPETVAEPAEGELSPEDQSDHRAFQKLEQLNPARKGIADRFVQFVNARGEYEANWRKENPGKEFDQDADEHDAFYKQYAEFDSPKTAEELEDAKIELKIDERFEKRLKPLEEQRRVEQINQQIQPRILKEVVGRIQALAAKIDPELAKKLVDDKGNFRMSKDDLEKIREDFPVEYDVLDELVSGKKDHASKIIPQTSLVNVLSVLEQLPYSSHTGFRLNPQDPVHARVIDYMRDYENHMETAPADVKIQTFTDKTGQKFTKQFIAVQDLVEFQNQILSRKITDKAKQRQLQDLDTRYWTVAVDDIENIILDDLAAAAKAQIGKVNKLVEKKSGKLPERRTFSQPLPATERTGQVEKPQPPSLHTADVVSTSETGAPGSENLAENVSKKLFGTE